MKAAWPRQRAAGVGERSEVRGGDPKGSRGGQGGRKTAAFQLTVGYQLSQFAGMKAFPGMWACQHKTRESSRQTR